LLQQEDKFFIAFFISYVMNNRAELFDVFDLIIRYSLIIIAGLGNLYIFYLVFKPVTINLVAFIVNLFTMATMIGADMIYINGLYFEFVNACIGGSAYYLLFILGMSSRGVPFVKRMNVIVFSFFLLFLFNIFRVLLMILVAHEVYFNVLHWVFWYFLATLFVFLDWIFVSRYFKITSIPVYSDFIFLAHSIFGVSTSKTKRTVKNTKKKKRSRKKK
jgi:hypothetical protein